MPERGLERKVEGRRRLLRSRVHPAWINYEIGGLWISSSTETTFCLRFSRVRLDTHERR